MTTYLSSNLELLSSGALPVHRLPGSLASFCPHVRMSVTVLLHLRLSLGQAGGQANKDEGQENYCVPGLLSFHDALHARARAHTPYKSN